MRADYDSEGDTIRIDLEPGSPEGYGEDVENGVVIVQVHENRPVVVNVMGTGAGFSGALRTAADRYSLDAEALLAAAQAALAAPDREVTVDVAVRAAA